MNDEISPHAAAHAMAAAELLLAAWRGGEQSGTVSWSAIEEAVRAAEIAIEHQADTVSA